MGLQTRGLAYKKTLGRTCDNFLLIIRDFSYVKHNFLNLSYIYKIHHNDVT